METAVVEIREISKHFGAGATRVDALRKVSLDIFPGSVIGLRGPSGSGKSTLLNVIGCILEPNSGSMRLNGDLVYDGKWLRSDLRALRLEKIGFIFQAHNLLPFLNAWENVAIARILAGASRLDGGCAGKSGNLCVSSARHGRGGQLLRPGRDARGIGDGLET